MIADVPTVWLQRCLDIMALDPLTAEASTGIPAGQMRPEYGPAIQELACNNCAATWAGIVGDPCWWCQDSLERQHGYQIELLLRAPEVDPDDETYDDRMWAWAQRLKNAVDTDLITRDEAERKYRLAMRRVA